MLPAHLLLMMLPTHLLLVMLHLLIHRMLPVSIPPAPPALPVCIFAWFSPMFPLFT